MVPRFTPHSATSDERISQANARLVAGYKFGKKLVLPDRIELYDDQLIQWVVSEFVTTLRT
jgi:hypothetical protein